MEWWEAVMLGIACGVIAAAIMPAGNWFEKAAFGGALGLIVAYLFNAIAALQELPVG